MRKFLICFYVLWTVGQIFFFIICFYKWWLAQLHEHSDTFSVFGSLLSFSQDTRGINLYSTIYGFRKNQLGLAEIGN